MNRAPCRLRVSTGMSCGPTAVCAVSGRNPKEVLDAIRKSAKAAGLPADFEADEETAFCDQVNALEILGMALFHHDETPMEANEIPRARDAEALYELNVGHTLEVFLQRFPTTGCRELVIGHATRPKRCGGGFESHTFALDRIWYFDNNTPKGGPVPFSEASADLLDMRVIDVVLVRRP